MRSTEHQGQGGDVLCVDVVFPEWLNHHGTLFAGRALELLSRAAFIAATRATRRPVVLARVVDMDFLAPVRQGDLVVVSAGPGERTTRSLLVRVDVEAEEALTGKRRVAVRGSVLMVIVDDDGKSRRDSSVDEQWVGVTA